jgi:hypothetical protein
LLLSDAMEDIQVSITQLSTIISELIGAQASLSNNEPYIEFLQDSEQIVHSISSPWLLL